MINDNYIINYFYTKTCLNGRLLKNIPIDLLNYLNNRYNDSLSIKETLYRIKNNIEIRPICPICGNKLIFKDKDFFSTTCSKECTNKLRLIKIQQTLVNKYGVDNCQKIKSVHKKTKQTCLEKYGVDNPAKSEIIKEKVKQTCIKKYNQLNGFNIKKAKQTYLLHYGVNHNFKSKEVKEKIKQTCLEKYGQEYFINSNDFKLKSKETYLRKYGQEYFVNSKKINESKLLNNDGKYYSLDKYHKTCLEKYGVNHWKKSEYGKKIGSEIMSNPIIQEKRNKTLRNNNSFNNSLIEKQLLEYFLKNNIKFITQYSSDLYPFKCDFYLIDYDLYIEINGIWTHGGHPYDSNNIEDINKLNIWKNKNTKYYDNAIYTWTNLDIRKRNIAKKNNLNYLEIFSNNLNICIEKIKKIIYY